MNIKKLKDKNLYLKSLPISDSEFGKDLDKCMSDMAELCFANQGIGLSGNQVGILKRILIVDLGYVIGKNYGEDFIKIVNPEIISQNDKQLLSEEGCLSFPELAVRVSRPENIVLKYQDPYGNFIQREFADWQARIILHEIDHLNAITLYSRASTLIRNRYDKRMKKNTYDM